MNKLAIRIIVKHPDPVLREKSMPVKKINSNLHKLLDDMAATMHDAQGIGIAAPQVGVTKRVALVHVDDEHGLIECINPEIIDHSEDEEIGTEGCLSIPGLLGDVRRYSRVTVRALNRAGEQFEMETEGLLARAFQHEIDHLNGVLFIDIADSVYDNSENVQ